MSIVKQDSHWYEELFDTVLQFVCILDQHGTVVNVNQAALVLTDLRQNDIIGETLWDIPWKGLSKTYRNQLKKKVKEALEGNFVRTELEVHHHQEPKQVVDFTLKPIRDANMDISFVIVEGRDISVYKRTTEELFQSNVRFAAIFEKAGIGIVIKRTDGKILDCNPAFVDMLGYPVEELRKVDYLAITYPKDRPISRKLFNELQEGKRDGYSMEKRYVCKDGKTVWASINATAVLDAHNKPQFTIMMVENITPQKAIEAEVVELRQRLMQGREMERLKMAQDLHDGPLQEVIGVTYQLKDIENFLDHGDGSELLQGIQEGLQKISRSIRSICSELRPSTLMPFGLEKAILSHTEEFQSAHPDIQITLELEEDGQRLSEHVRLALFRIYQEALNNILRHANASQVWVKFHFNENEASLEVQDNGEGFKPPDHWIELARKGHLGLVGSMERATEVGGELVVSSAAGKGTLIRAAIPIGRELVRYE